MREVKNHPPLRWIFLCVAAAAECAAYALIAHLRYANQSLPAEYFNFTRTGNVLYAIYAVAMLWCIVHIIFQRHRHQHSIRVLACMSVVSCALIEFIILIPSSGSDWLFGTIGIIKLMNLGLATTLVEHKHLMTTRTAIEHFIIILIFVFAGPTDVFGLSPPTDVPSSEHADAAVILGAAVWSHNRPSPLLHLRISKALDLYNSKIVDNIVCTGSNPYGNFTESDAERAELLKSGIDAARISVERKSSSTIGQVIFMRDSLQPRCMHTFIIVSDHFHLQRALEMCRFNNIHALGAASESSLEWEFISLVPPPRRSCAAPVLGVRHLMHLLPNSLLIFHS